MEQLNATLTPKEQRELAIEELKLLQSIIGRLENIMFIMRGWLYTLIAGLVAVLFRNEANLSNAIAFIISGLVFTFIFCFTEVFQRVPMGKAIQRSKDVEIEVNIRQYNGTKIYNISSKRKAKNVCEYLKLNMADVKEALQGPRVVFPYGLLAAGIILLGIVRYCLRNF